jgi:NADPH-dependent F420 reductase
VIVNDTCSTIGIVGGTGDHGRGLGYRLAAGGHRVIVGSRDRARAQQSAQSLTRMLPAGATPVTGTTNQDAAASADVILLTMPWTADGSAISGLRAAVQDKIVVSCANPIGFDSHGPHQLDTGYGSAAEHVVALLPGSRIVGAFHHLSARTLLDPHGDLSADDVLVCGDDNAAKVRVRHLCRAVTGRAGIDAGPLRLARQIEPFTAVLISVNRRYRIRSGFGLRHVADLEPGELAQSA